MTVEATAVQVPILKRLEPNVSESEAQKILSRSAGWTAPLRSIAEVWLPYHLYEMSVTNGGRAAVEMLAIDAVEGTLDLLSVDPGSTFQDEQRTKNHVPPRLEARAAGELLRDKVRRIIFRRGFFRIRDLSLEPRHLDQLLYVPYWVGFFGRSEVSRIRVVDAVRRTVEGAKATHLISAWLHEQPAPSEFR